MFTQPGIPRTLQGSHTNIFCMIYNIGRLGRDLIEIFVLDWRALKLSSAYGRTLKASIRRSWYKLFMERIQYKNIVCIGYGTSWYTGEHKGR